MKRVWLECGDKRPNIVLADALAIADETSYGLAAAVWTRDLSKARPPMRSGFARIRRLSRPLAPDRSAHVGA